MEASGCFQPNGGQWSIVYSLIEARDKLFTTWWSLVINCFWPNGGQWLNVSDLMEASD